ncbi:hypothetical protein [Paenibacillus sp. GCM10027626]|uniref:hypothetical protein n=1 Tax=Paenibacillus sp. GCM10027626 TaxID=3273411 RepID=UPI00362D22E8
MESAKLHHLTIDIERERLAAIRRGASLEAARAELEEHYRVYSREKAAFKCICCDGRVVMVLYADKALFRHYDSEACAGERNYARYAVNREKLAELADRHAEGKELLRRELAALQGEHFTFTDGYLYKKELRVVPDFVINADNGDRWAIDYVVTLKGDAAYYKKLLAKLACYRAHGFKPLFLLDRSWLSITESAYVAVNKAELAMRTPDNPYDELWQKELAMPPLAMEAAVHSLVYLDVPREKAILIRFQMSDPRWGRLLFEPCELPLSHLLDVDVQWLHMTGETMLQLFRSKEQLLLQGYRSRLYELLQEEQAEREEEERRRHALEARVEQLRAASLPGKGREQQQSEASQAEPAAAEETAPAVSPELAKLLALLASCEQSPRRADYPGLEANLARAAALTVLAREGGEEADQAYKSAWSILRNISYPLLGR